MKRYLDSSLVIRQLKQFLNVIPGQFKQSPGSIKETWMIQKHESISDEKYAAKPTVKPYENGLINEQCLII